MVGLGANYVGSGQRAQADLANDFKPSGVVWKLHIPPLVRLAAERTHGKCLEIGRERD
jgi:hypothetical protein